MNQWFFTKETECFRHIALRRGPSLTKLDQTLKILGLKLLIYDVKDVSYCELSFRKTKKFYDLIEKLLKRPMPCENCIFYATKLLTDRCRYIYKENLIKNE